MLHCLLACDQVARVLTVSELANSEKLYKLSIDVGNGETKQVLSTSLGPAHAFVPVSGRAGGV